jgi:hypothetical protein
MQKGPRPLLSKEQEQLVMFGVLGPQPQLGGGQAIGLLPAEEGAKVIPKNTVGFRRFSDSSICWIIA